MKLLIAVAVAGLVAAPQAHADEFHPTSLTTEICNRLASQNLSEATHDVARLWVLDLVTEVIPAAFEAVHNQCPEWTGKLPEQKHTKPPRMVPTDPVPGPIQPRSTQPKEPDYYGDEPFGPHVVSRLEPQGPQEDEPGWDCRTQGNRICGPDNSTGVPAGDYNEEYT